MINWARVTELRDEIGADDFDDVVDIFLEEVEHEITRLRGAFDRANLESILHLLKGCALNLGFCSFSALCQKGETAAAAGETESIDVQEIIASYFASKDEFLEGMTAPDAA